MHRFKVLALTSACLGLSVLAPEALRAYGTYAKWNSSAVPYLINPANSDVTASAAQAAIQTGAGAWGTQSSANFSFVYAGLANDTATANDGRNVVMFRNATNGAALATTYSWWSGSTLQDADIIFWDAAYTFYTGSSGCSGGAFIEDVATHEFGHALGLQHSTVTDATMYPSYSYCSTDTRSLAADDIAGVEALYPPSSTATNTAPAVAITAPGAGASFVEQTLITFGGTAADSQDGDLSSRIVWTSSLDGQIGVGGGFTRSLSVGTHVITATATDAGGLSGTASVTVSVVAATSTTTTTGAPNLAAKAYKVKGRQQSDLSWTGVAATTVDVFRNGARVATVANTGATTDVINARGGGSYTYQVCGGGTSTCSNKATVVF